MIVHNMSLRTSDVGLRTSPLIKCLSHKHNHQRLVAYSQPSLVLRSIQAQILTRLLAHATILYPITSAPCFSIRNTPNDLPPFWLPAANRWRLPDNVSGERSVRCQSSLATQKSSKSWNSIQMSLDSRIGSSIFFFCGNGVNRMGVPRRVVLGSWSTKCRHSPPIGNAGIAVRPPPLRRLAGRM